MDVAVYAARCPKGREGAAARRLLALAVGQEYGLTALPAIERESGGKPFFPDRPDICFNLSHSHGAVVCALHDRSVGVDVERLRPAPPRLARGMEDVAFFRLWTGREATVKRSGQAGLAVLMAAPEPDRLCVCREDFLPGWIVTVCPSEAAPIRWVTAGAIPEDEETAAP